MARRSVADFLIRVVLDEAFRELAMADPSRAFEGYDLSEEEQDILRSRDARLLGLLGTAVPHAKASVEHPPEEVPSKAPASSFPTLPEVKLLLRLEPQATQAPDSASQVAYAASLHPWPGDYQPTGAGAEGGEHSAPHDDAKPPPMAWIVRITPTVVDSQETGLTVAYSASIHPFVPGMDERQLWDQGPAQPAASSPWNHHLESSAAKAAARAVREADAGQRYQKLLELIQALQTGDQGG
jgi:hypothetical protein